MDPLTALGLAGNIIQVISFTHELVSEGNKIYHAVDGVLIENKDYEEVAHDLDLLTSRLTESQRTWLASHPNSELDPDEVQLRNICDRCSEIAIELTRNLQKLRVQEGTKHRRLKSYKQALISVWRKDAVEDIASRLERYQREMDSRILVGLRKSLQDASIQSSAQYGQLDQRTKDLFSAIVNSGNRLETSLGDQHELLSRIADGQDHTHQMLMTIVERSRVPSPGPPAYEQATSGSSAAEPTPLHEAAEGGQVLEVRKILRNPNADVNAKDQYGCTPLHLASSVEVAKRLVNDKRVDHYAEDYEGRTALHYAVLKRRLGVVKVLLEANVDKTLEDDNGKTATFYACECPAALWMLKYGVDTEVRAVDHLDNTGLIQMAWLGDVEGCKFFLEQSATVNARNALGETALTEACRHGDLGVTELLLRAGADTEICADKDWTALLQAIRDGRENVVPVLLKYRARQDARLASGNTPLAEACWRYHFGIARLLIEAGSSVHTRDCLGKTPLLRAASGEFHGDAAFVRFVLARGADKDAKDNEGHTAVYEAAKAGHAEVLRELLSAGAAADVRTEKHKWTPLGQAARLNRFACVKMLLDHGADPNLKGHFDHAPLAEAAHHGNLGIVELLLDHGADIETTAGRGYRPLAIAAHQGKDDVVKLLVTRGANIEAIGFSDIKADFSFTALIRAAQYGRSSTVAVLAELGADVNARDNDDRTALTLATWENHKETVAMLIQKGANINARSNGGMTALHNAAMRGHVEVARLLVEANANLRLRDSRGCTAWTVAVHTNRDRQFRPLLQPHPEEDELLLNMQAERHPREIAAYLNEVYRDQPNTTMEIPARIPQLQRQAMNK